MKTLNRFLILCAGIGALSGALIPAVPAAGGQPPARPAARPTVQPLPTSAPRTPLEAPGGHIQLSADATAIGLRAVVQWQGGDGRWYDVDGWRSEMHGVATEWWVAPKDLGKGPFRWVAYRAGEAQPQRVSETFMLPKDLGQRVNVAWAAVK